MSESNNAPLNADALQFVQYHGSKEETYLPAIRQLISKDLSEPYSIYVYRYFLYQWGDLCYMAHDSSSTLIGVVVCKLEPHRSGTFRGYIAMLAVQEAYRGKGIATKLVCMAIDTMKARDADEIVLETEVTNTASLKLYERLGFLRSKRLHRYYLNGNTAFRLVLYLKPGTATKSPDGDMMGRGYTGHDSLTREDGVMTDDREQVAFGQVDLGHEVDAGRFRIHVNEPMEVEEAENEEEANQDFSPELVKRKVGGWHTWPGPSTPAQK